MPPGAIWGNDGAIFNTPLVIAITRLKDFGAMGAYFYISYEYRKNSFIFMVVYTKVVWIFYAPIAPNVF